MNDAPLAIFYEHPDWFRPLFAELDRRGTEYVRIASDDHHFDPADATPRFSALFNRMSSASISARFTVGVCRARAAASSGLSPLTAEE